MLLNAAARQVADFFGVFRITKAQVGPCAALSPRVAAFRLCNQYSEATPPIVIARPPLIVIARPKAVAIHDFDLPTGRGMDCRAAVIARSECDAAIAMTGKINDEDVCETPR